MLMLIATLLFSVMQLWVKQLNHIPFYELIFFRALISLVLCSITIKTQKGSFVGNRIDLLIGRGIFGMASLTCFFYALQHMPLGSLIVIVNIKPFLVLLWASLFLKEKTWSFQWLLFGLCFIGIIWLKGVDQRIDQLALIATVGAAFFASIAHTFVRKLKDSDQPTIILFYFTLVTVPIVAPFTIFNWIMPVGIDWIYCLGIGLITHFAQLCLTAAYQKEEVAIVSNMYYLGIVFAFTFGFLFFEETYSLEQVSAVGLIVIGMILNIFFTRRVKKQSHS